MGNKFTNATKTPSTINDCVTFYSANRQDISSSNIILVVANSVIGISNILLNSILMYAIVKLKGLSRLSYKFIFLLEYNRLLCRSGTSAPFDSRIANRHQKDKLYVGHRDSMLGLLM